MFSVNASASSSGNDIFVDRSKQFCSAEQILSPPSNYHNDSDIKKFAKLLIVAVTGNSCQEVKDDLRTIGLRVEQSHTEEYRRELGREISSIVYDRLLLAAVGLWPPSEHFDINQAALNANVDNLLNKIDLKFGLHGDEDVDEDGDVDEHVDDDNY